MEATVSQLKDDLNSYLERVKAGDEIVITEGGEAIALVVPFTRGGPTPEEYEEMIRTGVIKPAEKPGGVTADFWDLPVPEDPEGIGHKMFLEDREKGW